MRARFLQEAFRLHLFLSSPPAPRTQSSGVRPDDRVHGALWAPGSTHGRMRPCSLPTALLSTRKHSQHHQVSPLHPWDLTPSLPQRRPQHCTQACSQPAAQDGGTASGGPRGSRRAEGGGGDREEGREDRSQLLSLGMLGPEAFYPHLQSSPSLGHFPINFNIFQPGDYRKMVSNEFNILPVTSWNSNKHVLYGSTVHKLSRVRPFVTPWTAACQAPLFMRFSRRGYWSRLLFPSPGDLSDPGTEPASLVSPALAGGFFTTGASREACMFS